MIHPKTVFVLALIIATTTAIPKPKLAVKRSLLNDLPQDSTPKDGKPPYIPENGYVSLPERGILLERTGTLISHTNYEVVSIVIKANPLMTKLDAKYLAKSTCDSRPLSVIKWDYQSKVQTLKNMTEAIFLSRDQLKTPNICLTFNLENCEHLSHRSKRFLLGAAALATAGTALGLTLDTRAQVEKIKNTLQGQEQKLHSLQDELDLVRKCIPQIS